MLNLEIIRLPIGLLCRNGMVLREGVNGYDLLVDHSMEYAIYYQNRISINTLIYRMNRCGSTNRSLQINLVRLLESIEKL